MTGDNLPYFPKCLARHTVCCHAFYTLKVFSLTRVARGQRYRWPVRGAETYIIVVLKSLFSFLHVSWHKAVQVFSKPLLLGCFFNECCLGQEFGM